MRSHLLLRRPTSHSRLYPRPVCTFGRGQKLDIPDYRDICDIAVLYDSRLLGDRLICVHAAESSAKTSVCELVVQSQPGAGYSETIMFISHTPNTPGIAVRAGGEGYAVLRKQLCKGIPVVRLR